MRWRWWYLPLLVLLVMAGPIVLPKIVHELGRGARVGRRTKLDVRLQVVFADGVNAGQIATPAELCESAGISELPIYTCARVLSSEHGSDGEIIKRAVAYAILNRSRGPSALHSVVAGRNGLYDAQKNVDGVEYVSTAQDPHDDDVRIATEVVRAWPGGDPTSGAAYFYSPRAQDALRLLGRVNYDADGIDAKWTSEGKVAVAVADVNPRTITFYRRAT